MLTYRLFTMCQAMCRIFDVFSHSFFILILLTHLTNDLALKDSKTSPGLYKQEVQWCLSLRTSLNSSGLLEWVTLENQGTLVFHLNTLLNLTYLGWHQFDILSHSFTDSFWILLFNSFVSQEFISIQGKKADKIDKIGFSLILYCKKAKWLPYKMWLC